MAGLRELCRPLDIGMKTTIDIDREGFVHATTAPRLGCEVNWDVIENSTIGEYK